MPTPNIPLAPVHNGESIPAAQPDKKATHLRSGLLPLVLVGPAAELNTETLKHYLHPEIIQQLYQLAEEREKDGTGTSADLQINGDEPQKFIMVNKDGHIVDGPFPLPFRIEGRTGSLASIEQASSVSLKNDLAPVVMANPYQGPDVPFTEAELDEAMEILLATGRYRGLSPTQENQLTEKLQEEHGYSYPIKMNWMD
ncbi:hypothetical protein PTTG_08871 [Puccinia triticina 1-1 BBBD Race 1]|uniref:Uncharacterized protein n=2 Tax=Puccinia triticina TaxID=208348 RepID=A0A0C4F6U7_PUCT1|nr:uncharacterized protein PtA15_13A306 [Puccinia triticina]OAV87774.1 hypothetical protein PTTG_08871 [Puccinia triticina 1-1 BBBD Race 1]WAQ90906.1 hypothetical protein PtA15_13A306 [Puccinia triticina]